MTIRTQNITSIALRLNLFLSIDFALANCDDELWGAI